MLPSLLQILMEMLINANFNTNAGNCFINVLIKRCFTVVYMYMYSKCISIVLFILYFMYRAKTKVLSHQVRHFV